MVFSLLFPQQCIACQKRYGDYFCEDCFRRIQYNFQQFCPRLNCGKPAMGGLTHAACQTKFGLDGHLSATLYQGSIKSLIEFVKRRKVQKLMTTVSDVMERYFFDVEDCFPLLPNEKPLVTAVPHFWLEQRQKKIDFVQDLAEIFAQIWEYPINFDVLQKVRYTRPQKDLKRKERLNNLKKAFRVNSPPLIQGKSVILIDDVWTTGSTLQECAQTLKRAGAKNVWAITLARGI